MVIREEKEIKAFQIGKEEIRLSLSADDMILYIAYSKCATRKMLEIINEIGKLGEYRISCLYNNKPTTLLVKCTLVVLWRTVWRFFKKLKIEVLYDPSFSLLGIYPEKIIIQNDTYTPSAYCSTIYNS